MGQMDGQTNRPTDRWDATLRASFAGRPHKNQWTL